MIPASVQKWIVPVTLMVLWEVLGRAGSLPSYLSYPTIIGATLWEITVSGELATHFWASVFRVYGGYALGAAAGVTIGLGAGLLIPVRSFFDPLVSFLYPIPKVAFLPIFLLLFGLGHASKVIMIAFSVFFPVFINSRYAVISVNKLYIWTAQNMGASRRTVFFRVVLPAALPQLFSGLRVGMALSFILLFAGELIGSRAGLGQLIIQGEEWVRFDLMFAGIVCFAVLGFISDRVLMAVRKRMLKGHLIGTEEQVI